MATQAKGQKKKTVIAYRKKCQAKGTGLSHYILADKKAK
jgi:modified peptide precursor CbpA